MYNILCCSGTPIISLNQSSLTHLPDSKFQTQNLCPKFWTPKHYQIIIAKLTNLLPDTEESFDVLIYAENKFGHVQFVGLVSDWLNFSIVYSFINQHQPNVFRSCNDKLPGDDQVTRGLTGPNKPVS